MFLNAYSIYDVKAGIFSQPYFSVNNAAAVRAFAQVANDPGNQIAVNPEDYVLYKVGTFNDQTGDLNQEHTIERLANGFEVKRRDEA